MKLWMTRPSPYAKVLVLLASLCFVMSCGKSQAESGKSGPGSNQSQTESNKSQAESGKSDPGNNKSQTESNKSEPESGKSDAPIGDRDALVTQKNTNEKTPKSDSPGRQAAKGPTYASRGVKDDEAVAMQRRTSARPNERDSESSDLLEAVSNAYRASLSGSFEPADLIARASEMIHSTPTITRAFNDSGGDKSRYQQAAMLAEQGIAMLKVQQEPSELTAKAEYRATLLEGLSIRAEALGVLATQGDRSRGRAAETAYREYLAAESNSIKKTRAEYKFASMLVALGELDKARSTYEGLLARNVDDKEALAGLVFVHRKIAVAQKAAGKEAAATINTELSASYAERLNKLPSEPAATTADVDAGTEIREYNMRTKSKAAEGYELPAKRQSLPPTERAYPARPKVEEVERQRARRRPGE
jgi:hypothetical protein